jgi:lysophospholipase L1-like esterase
VRPGLAFRHRTPEFDVTIYTNDEGMRTGPARAPVGDKKPGVFRVLFLGTSYAFGWGSEYQDSYAARIAAGLAGRGLEVEVLNLGTPAQNAAPQLCWLRENARRIRPDLVIQTVFANPSVLAASCAQDPQCPAVEDGYLVRPSHGSRLLGELGKRSALVFYGWYLRQRYVAGGSRAEAVGGQPPELGAPAEEGPDDLRRRYEGFVRSVREAAGEPIEVCFLLIPPAFVVHPEDAARWGPIGAKGEEFRARGRAAARSLEASGLRFIDATPALQQASGGERMFYWLDTHLTPAGNRAVADLVLSRLPAVTAPPLRDHEGG